MKLLKQSKRSQMLDIYECPFCRKPEYYGMLHWRDGHQFCRSCIYELWTKEGYEAAKNKELINAAKYDEEPNLDNLKYWKPTETDYIFPKYEDGIDYSIKREDYVD